MAIAPLTPLPSPPLSTDTEAVFNSKADATLLAEKAFVEQMNSGTIPGINQAVTDSQAARDAAAASAGAAAGSVTAAAQQVTLATEQKALAVTARQGSEAARDQAQVYAHAAGAAVGPLPVANRFLGTDSLNNVGWYSVVIPARHAIGDIVVGAANPGSDYLPANGGVYLQSAYPEWIAKFGKTPIAFPDRLTPFSIDAYPGSSGYTLRYMRPSADFSHLVFAGYPSGLNGCDTRVFKRSGTTLTYIGKLPTANTSVGGVVALAVTIGGTFVGQAVQPIGGIAKGLEIFKRSGDVFSSLTITPSPSDSTLPYGSLACDGSGVWWVQVISTGAIHLYKRTGDSVARVSILAGNARSVAMSADGNYMVATSTAGAPWINLYKRNGDTFDLMPNTHGGTMPSSAQYRIDISADGSRIVSSPDSAGVVYTFRRVGDTLTGQASVPNTGIGTTSVSISTDGDKIIIGSSSGIRKVTRSGEAWTVASAYSGASVQEAYICGDFATYLTSYIVSKTGNNTIETSEYFRDAYSFDPNTEFSVPSIVAQNSAVSGSNTAPPQVTAHVRVK
ncbi:hypothetical protein NJC38_21945 [Pseudomonas sp. 21LCFQ010]|uniref:hypothetical protein n=1 Tax=Pseudomonas sp. 21LCFQ010 TaxID=2957506 RepID=UPI002097195A|nr:hypothetical protein [Pseudomonas sp. 21LCFQ010]MCO8164804.1 hypothetical protein [Pseudomonas sp. 21LCFQ010]